MATWYTADTAAEQQRLIAAWPDAPISNTELCQFILDTARDQIETYAPDVVAPVYEPATLTWPDAGTGTLTRTGDRVDVTVSKTANSAVYLPLPVGYAPATTGASITLQESGAAVITVTGRAYSFQPGTIRLSTNGLTGTFALSWVGESAEGDGIPAGYALAQLQQARNLWNAGRVTGEGEVGPDGFVFRPYPLDKTIKQMVRPIEGYSSVL